MIYQQMSFFDEQDQTVARSFRGGSLVSRTALQDSVKRLVMSVICGRKCGESLARLDQNGSWLRMFGDYCQAKMDGSFEEFSGILPTWGLMLDGVLYQPHQLVPYIDESEWRLLPTIAENEWKGSGSKRFLGSRHYKGAKCSEMIRTSAEDPHYLNQNFAEVMMGFPIGWTDLSASETQ